MLEILETQPGVQIVEEERSPYNPEFVEKITAARKEKGGKIVTSENLWQNIK
jgi:DICT domain-containing protein